MNFRNLIAELVDIERRPNHNYVTITRSGNATTYEFTQYPEAYYYPDGIRRIRIERGGAGVVYVYTTPERYPHLTIPDSGQNLHWTDEGRNRSTQWPNCIARFIALFP